MPEQKKVVSLFVFDAKDEKSTRERIKAAAGYYSVHTGETFIEHQFEIKRTERGKPYFPNCPEIGVSVSHSGDYFVCALAKGEVGIDLQEHRMLASDTVEDAEIRLRRIAGRFFNPTETEFAEINTFYRFYALWAAKESYVKYTGKGIDNDFSGFNVLPVNVSDARALDCGNDYRWSALDKEFFFARFKENYSLCICADGSYDVKIIYMSRDD